MNVSQRHMNMRIYEGHTFSFFSVSSLREADKDSRVSMVAAEVEPLTLRDCRRDTEELREAEARAEMAERAVAPLEIDGEDE